MISRPIHLCLALALAALAVSSAACGGKSGIAAVDYSVSAQKNYERGMKMLAEKEWAAAAKYFAFIKSRFPYSKYAVLAELRLADSEFGAEQHLEAVDSYKLFAKLHPTHEMVDNGYVSLRVAEAYYAMLPGDFWMIPPSYEKDQSSIEDAEGELRRFLDKYPDSPFRKKAEELLAKITKRLAQHEWYVATYYWDRDKPTGTVLRLRRLLERYPGVGFDSDALWLLGRAYRDINMPDRAREAWNDLVAKFPTSKQAESARVALGRLPPASTSPSTQPSPLAPAPPAP